MNTEQYKYKLFGRFKGRKRNSKNDSSYTDKYNYDPKINLSKNKYNILDIGSGSGENTIHLSKVHLNSHIIACELFEDGNINLCNQINLNQIENISLYKGNALEFLDSLNQKYIFDEIWILFPDPWPKKRHHKRRLISGEFLELIYFFLKKNAKLLIASDSSTYKRSIIKFIYTYKHLYLWENQDFEEWSYDLLNLPKTKFNQKAIKSERNSMIFKLSRI